MNCRDLMSAIAEKLDTLQSIELAEGVAIRLRIAGPLLRVWAWSLDLIFMAVATMIVGIVLGLMGILVGGKVVTGVMSLFMFFLSWWYPVFFESSAWGATFGKRICGLRVMQPSGAPITFSQAVVRNFLRVVDINPPFFGLPGLACCLATRRFQRLGDLAAGTVVVYERQEIVPEASGPGAGQALAPTVALSAEEARAIVTFRERSVYWSEARRREIADHLGQLTRTHGSPGVAKILSMAQWLQEKR